jgi:hypothetical protein
VALDKGNCHRPCFDGSTDLEEYLRDQWKVFPELKPYNAVALFPSRIVSELPHRSSAAKSPSKASVMGFEGGEKEDHLCMKKYIADNPSVIGLSASAKAKTGYPFWSGDRADILFTFADSLVIVEIKPARSPQEDIYRGLHQCIKYKALIRAEQIIDGKIPNGKAILVVGRKVSQVVADHAHRLSRIAGDGQSRRSIKHCR